MPRYVDGKLLGSGGFGRVGVYRDTQTRGYAALKFLIKGDADARGRFSNEAMLLQRHDGHPNIVRFIEFRGDRAEPYLAMEYCELGSLRSWVGGKRSWEWIGCALQEAANGLAAVHGSGGIHRDVKPENLLVTMDKRAGREVIKLSDFGIAREPVTGRPNITRSAMGTRGYIAPEILNGAQFWPAADMYSLGVTGVELLSGRKTVGAIATIPLPQYFRELLKRMCSLDARQRPSAKQVADGLAWLLWDENADRRLFVERREADWEPVVAAVAVGLLVVAGVALLSKSA